MRRVRSIVLALSCVVTLLFGWVAEAGTLVVTAAPPITASGGSFTGAVATFTDSDATLAASDFTATINWGDSSTSAGASPPP